MIQWRMTTVDHLTFVCLFCLEKIILILFYFQTLTIYFSFTKFYFILENCLEFYFYLV